MKKKLFIALEGIDGSGKSTQIDFLAENLKMAGHKVYTTFEPTDGPVGSLIRNIFNHRIEADHKTIAGLFVADRLDHLTNKTNGILKKMEDGYTVITDRYYFSSYAYHVPEGEKISFRFGEGLAGQVAKEGKMINIDAVPEGYIRILSGLGSASPRHLIIIPLKEADQVRGVVEIASFHSFSSQTEIELQQTFDKLALKLINDDNVSLENAKH